MKLSWLNLFSLLVWWKLSDLVHDDMIFRDSDMDKTTNLFYDKNTKNWKIIFLYPTPLYSWNTAKLALNTNQSVNHLQVYIKCCYFIRMNLIHLFNVYQLSNKLWCKYKKEHFWLVLFDVHVHVFICVFCQLYSRIYFILERNM